MLGAAAAAASTLIPGRWRLVTLTQSLLPWAVTPAVVLGHLARRRGRGALAATAALAIAGAAAGTARQVVPRRTTEATGTPVRISNLNLLYANARMDEVADLIDRLDVDVHALCELTPTHRATLHRLIDPSRWPHRLEHPALAASGTAIWSRWPLRPVDVLGTKHHTVAADIDTPDGTLRVVATHTQSPLILHREWRDDMAFLATIDPAAGPPAVLVGDLNAVWWHPELRRLTRRGWRDAHLALGRGLSPSWPYDGRFVPFLRLDHALVDERLVITGIEDFEIPGDDHRGFVVTVSRR